MSTRQIESVEDSSRDEGERKHANPLMLGGLGIGMIAAGVGGAVCPVCVVAAPALLCIGAY